MFYHTLMYSFSNLFLVYDISFRLREDHILM